MSISDAPREPGIDWAATFESMRHGGDSLPCVEYGGTGTACNRCGVYRYEHVRPTPKPLPDLIQSEEAAHDG